MPALEVLVTDLAFGLLLGCVFAVIAHGLNLIWGVAKIVNVAHGVFIMLGAYGAYFLNLYLGINPLLSAPWTPQSALQSEWVSTSGFFTGSFEARNRSPSKARWSPSWPHLGSRCSS